MRKTWLATSAGALAALALAGAADGATVALNIAETSGQTTPMPGGGTAYVAPFTGLRLIATTTNDVGAPPLPAGGQSATVDLIARTVDGEKVVDSQTIFQAAPVNFLIQYPKQNTTYYARLNAAPANGVAAPTASNEVAAPTFLRNYPGVSRNAARRRVTFSGFFADPGEVNVRGAVRVLIQRKSGSKWNTVKIITPTATRNWKAIVPYGTLPAVWRVRTVPVAPARYQKVTEVRYCLARSTSAARKACAGVALGIN